MATRGQLFNKMIEFLLLLAIKQTIKAIEAFHGIDLGSVCRAMLHHFDKLAPTAVKMTEQ